MTPDVANRLAILRQKTVDGTITFEELKEGVRLMRGDRQSAVRTSDSSRRARAKAEIPSADDMLDELGKI